jgi:hypothetical protein
MTENLLEQKNTKFEDDSQVDNLFNNLNKRNDISKLFRKTSNSTCNLMPVKKSQTSGSAYNSNNIKDVKASNYLSNLFVKSTTYASCKYNEGINIDNIKDRIEEEDNHLGVNKLMHSKSDLGQDKVLLTISVEDTDLLNDDNQKNLFTPKEIDFKGRESILQNAFNMSITNKENNHKQQSMNDTKNNPNGAMSLNVSYDMSNSVILNNKHEDCKEVENEVEIITNIKNPKILNNKQIKTSRNNNVKPVGSNQSGQAQKSARKPLNSNVNNNATNMSTISIRGNSKINNSKIISSIIPKGKSSNLTKISSSSTGVSQQESITSRSQVKSNSQIKTASNYKPGNKSGMSTPMRNNKSSYATPSVSNFQQTATISKELVFDKEIEPYKDEILTELESIFGQNLEKYDEESI